MADETCGVPDAQGLAAADLSLRRLVEQHAESEAVSALKGRCAELQARITMLEEGIRIRDGILTDQAARLTSQSSQLAAQNASLAEMRGARDAALAQSSLLADALTEMKNSRSWKITSPMRVVGTAVRRLRPRSGNAGR